MTFLGNPCRCGWAYDQIDEHYMFCERCGRYFEIREDSLIIHSQPTIDVPWLGGLDTAALREYAKTGYKIDPHTKLKDLLNDRRGAIAAKKAKLRAREERE